jgi:hypothetical protein
MFNTAAQTGSLLLRACSFSLPSSSATNFKIIRRWASSLGLHDYRANAVSPAGEPHTARNGGGRGAAREDR